MQDLQLMGVHPDEEHLLLVAGDGQRYRLVIDEALRAAIRRDRSRLGQLQSSGPGAVRPRDIQMQIRSGMSAEEVAKSAGIPLEHVRRYEGPVLAEREHVAATAQKHRLRGQGMDGPATLGEQVAERLAAREVTDVEWDAWRLDDGSWIVQAQFRAGTTMRKAQWSFSPHRAHLEPMDDEARWLMARDADGPLATSAARTFRVRDDGSLTSAVAEPAPVSAEQSFASTAELLNHLEARRGVRTASADPIVIDVTDTVLGGRSESQAPAGTDGNAVGSTGAADESTFTVVRSVERVTVSDDEVTAVREQTAIEVTVAESSESEQGSSEQQSAESLVGVGASAGAKTTTEKASAATTPPVTQPKTPAAAKSSGGNAARRRKAAVAAPSPQAAAQTSSTTASAPAESAPQSASAAKPAAAKGNRRPKVPSWDEIMFGSRKE